MNSKESSLNDSENLCAINLNQPRIHHSTVVDDINFPEHSLDNSIPPGNLYGNNDYPGMSMFSTGFTVAQNCKNQVSLFFHEILLTNFLIYHVEENFLYV